MDLVPVGPLNIAHMGLAEIRPLVPGFQRVEICPQSADLEHLALTAHTVQGSLQFECRGTPGSRELTLTSPSGCEGELVLNDTEAVDLVRLAGPAPAGHQRCRVRTGQRTVLQLKNT